jgi:hypothetical protein
MLLMKLTHSIPVTVVDADWEDRATAGALLLLVDVHKLTIPSFASFSESIVTTILLNITLRLQVNRQ